MRDEGVVDERPEKSSLRATAPVRLLGFRGSDEELLRWLQRGDPGAAAMLHARFAVEVNRLVWRLLGADQDHDDIVQHIFCKLLVSAKRVRDAEKLSGWVRSVTVNAVYSELRKRSVRRLFLAAQAVQPEQFEDSVANAEAREVLARVYTVLARMPVADRIAFSLRYLDGKQLAEVAELCGCSLATAKRRISRAHDCFGELREAMAGWEAP
jgi:RNA polymerase sigma-70 factor, ECF subfamily